VKAKVLDILPRLRTHFLVDDLYHLMRGGRLSKSSALIGSLVNIKPLLWLDTEGKLVPLAKLRGRKKGIKEMLTRAMTNVEASTAIVAYSNDEASAQDLKEKLLDSPVISEVLIMPLGPIISAHVGPNTLAVFTIGHDPR
ncbi:DegV family protein, partial [Streptococcus sobrinus]